MHSSPTRTAIPQSQRVLAACILLATVSLVSSPKVSAEEFTNSLRLPHAPEAIGAPRCPSRDYITGLTYDFTIADQIAARLGTKFTLTPEVVEGPIIHLPVPTVPITPALERGRATCGATCFLVPASANVRGNARVISSKYSWPPPGDPGFLPTDQYYENDGLPWLAISGPITAASGSHRILCWIAKNWSNDLDRVIEITLSY
jgi:hypothetical protein